MTINIERFPSASSENVINQRSMVDAFPKGSESVLFGMGCFWGVEQKLWQQEGVWVTSVGYSGGTTSKPDYQQVCDGQTGHTEVVHVVYQPEVISFASLLQLFWESHDPTQGMRQGNDIGDQYRSAIYCESEHQLAEAESSKVQFQKTLSGAGFGEITTEIAMASTYFMAEEYHQQYLVKNPGGYCGLKGTGVQCLI